MAGASPRRPGANSDTGPATRRSRSGTRPPAKKTRPPPARSDRRPWPGLRPRRKYGDGWSDDGTVDQPRRPSDRDRRGRRAGRACQGCGHRPGPDHPEGAHGSDPCITFSPDGKRIATASQDQTIKIWDAEDGREVLTLRGHTHVVQLRDLQPRRPPPRLGRHRHHGPGLGCDPVLARRPARAGGPQDRLPAPSWVTSSRTS